MAKNIRDVFKDAKQTSGGKGVAREAYHLFQSDRLGRKAMKLGRKDTDKAQEVLHRGSKHWLKTKAYEQAKFGK